MVHGPRNVDVEQDTEVLQFGHTIVSVQHKIFHLLPICRYSLLRCTGEVSKCTPHRLGQISLGEAQREGRGILSPSTPFFHEGRLRALTGNTGDLPYRLSYLRARALETVQYPLEIFPVKGSGLYITAQRTGNFAAIDRFRSRK